MQAPALTFSDDQAEAYDRLSAAFLGAGIDLAEGELSPMAEGRTSAMRCANLGIMVQAPST